MTSKKKSSKKRNTSNSKQSIDQMKYEIASEFGVKLGADASSRANGTVGGEITRRLVKKALNKTNGSRSKKNQ